MQFRFFRDRCQDRMREKPSPLICPPRSGPTHRRAPPRRIRNKPRRLPPLRPWTRKRHSRTATSPGSMARPATKTRCSIRSSSLRKSGSTRTTWRISTSRSITPSSGRPRSFRSGEVQIEQASVGGDFHWQNVRGRILFMDGMFATTTPRNDASSATAPTREIRRSRPVGPPGRLQICVGSLRRVSLQR